MSLARIAHVASLVVLLPLLCGGCGRHTPPATSTPATQAASRGYAGTIAEIDAQIADALENTQRYPDSWAMQEQLAMAYLDRARLSGNYDDYGAAEQAMDRAGQLAPTPAASCFPRARLAFSLHRLAPAAAAIENCRSAHGLADGVASELDGLSAEIAFYSGRYDTALAQLRRNLAGTESITNLARLARLHAASGHHVEALALLDRANDHYYGDSSYLRAWLQVQRAAILETAGRCDDAIAFLLAADRELPGWWLVQAQIAAAKAWLGQTEEARKIYRAQLQSRPLPELMDALAVLEADAGEVDRMRELSAAADKIHRARLARWPEAAAGHAVEHFLRFGDPAEALALARWAAQERPYGEARIRLAQALFRAGHASEALEEIRAVLDSSWNTAELHATAAQIAAATGNKELAETQRLAALQMNPIALRMYPLPAPPLPDMISLRQ